MFKSVSPCDHQHFGTGLCRMKLKETWKGLNHNLMKRIIWFIKELDRANTGNQLYLQLIINLIQNFLPPQQSYAQP